MFLGKNLLAYLVMALGFALSAGNIMALIKPPPKARAEGDLEQAPRGRSFLMIAIGAIAGLWSLASLIR
ncbi:MAG: hypothetical protein EXQ61_05060 [Ilumatobacteraceae bacterium]|nr:hypothetical protein [Ilumatobacteraceae bacterium]